MLKVYMKDIEGFGKEDWSDMLDNPNAPLFMLGDYDDWVEDRQVVFDVLPDENLFKGWETCPVPKFEFDLEHEGERVEYSEELSDLLADIASLNAVKCGLYHLNLFDSEFAGEMDSVSDEFGGAYDRALARALLLLLKELYAARGE